MNTYEFRLTYNFETENAYIECRICQARWHYTSGQEMFVWLDDHCRYAHKAMERLENSSGLSDI